MQKLLSAASITVMFTSLVFLAQAPTQATPEDGEFYDHAAVIRCQEATEEYFGWEGKVEWETHAALAFYNDYRSLQMVTARGKHPEGTVWADCAINHDTGGIVVYDFASGPYNPPTEPPELLTP